MAADALHFTMLAKQRIFCLGMIEEDLFPFPIGMAGFALRTEQSFVFIVFLVTTVTGDRHTLVFFFGVTTLALDFNMLAPQLEMRFAVIKVSRLPVLLLVTAGTILSQSALVLVCSFVALNALSRRLPVFLGWKMTILAKNFFL